jgi:predicted ATPase
VKAHRLVTIAGPGGVGKSRLAQAVASELRVEFDDAPITAEAALVGPRGSVAACMGRAIAPGSVDRSPADLAAWAATRRLLFVVENAEHVTSSARDAIGTLLQRAPNVRVLVTTQAPLQLSGEHVFRLAPLPLPPASTGAAGAAEGPAVQLLLDAVDAVMPGRALTDPDLRDAAAICRHLDGLPLALELAATRVPMFGLAGVRRMLPERLNMLVSGARGTSARERSLLGCLEWGWQMLGPDERSAAGALATLGTGFSLRSARRVLATAGFDGWQAMETLDNLVAKSFVLADGSDAPHFRMLESTRLFTAQRNESRVPLPGANIREHRLAKR